tara:strand:+ start:444 stop:731 length:288 start_codon:yes stop_codon:yes gene_type:complete
MKTKEILKEWRSFLLEGTSKRFKKDHIGKKVIVKDCCGTCHEKFDNIPKTGKLEGKLEVVNLPDRDGVNFVLVSVDNKKGKHFPECCVNLKNEKS